MPTSLADFNQSFRETTLAFLWRQWTALGVLGPAKFCDDWILDPEALLIHSLEFARCEARLFDQIISWVVTNGHWLDVARLRRFMGDLTKSENSVPFRLLGSLFHYLSENVDERKWKNIATYAITAHRKTLTPRPVEPLFKDRAGVPHPLVPVGREDPSFQLFSLNRPVIQNLKRTAETPINPRVNVRFMLRALLGIGAKSESLLYLLTHESGRPKEIADKTGYFWLTVQQALRDLSDSGLIMSLSRGKRLEYQASKKRWWMFLDPTETNIRTPSRWLNWGTILGGFTSLNATLETVTAQDYSPYLRMSRLQERIEQIHQEFSLSGLDIPPPPAPGLPPEQHQELIFRFVQSLLGVISGPSSRAG